MNPTDPNTLLPCPFCGKPGVAQHESFFTHGCASPKCPGYLGATSAEEWNTRAPSAEPLPVINAAITRAAKAMKGEKP